MAATKADKVLKALNKACDKNRFGMGAYKEQLSKTNVTTVLEIPHADRSVFNFVSGQFQGDLAKSISANGVIGSAIRLVIDTAHLEVRVLNDKGKVAFTEFFQRTPPETHR